MTIPVYSKPACVQCTATTRALDACGLVYFSSTSQDTTRFVARLGLPALCIPISSHDAISGAPGPYALICPTFADGAGRGAETGDSLPERSRPPHGPVRLIASGSRNFGVTFALAGRVIAEKCNVPMLYRFELTGNDLDITSFATG